MDEGEPIDQTNKHFDDYAGIPKILSELLSFKDLDNYEDDVIKFVDSLQFEIFPDLLTVDHIGIYVPPGLNNDDYFKPWVEVNNYLRNSSEWEFHSTAMVGGRPISIFTHLNGKVLEVPAPKLKVSKGSQIIIDHAEVTTSPITFQDFINNENNLDILRKVASEKEIENAQENQHITNIDVKIIGKNVVVKIHEFPLTDVIQMEQDNGQFQDQQVREFVNFNNTYPGVIKLEEI